MGCLRIAAGGGPAAILSIRRGEKIKKFASQLVAQRKRDASDGRRWHKIFVA
jgi:hypothetical protein